MPSPWRASSASPEPLTGVVEADEAWYGGPQDREKRRKYGRSSLMVLALAEARKDGRCRLVMIGDNSGSTLISAIGAHVAPDSTIQTDGWRSYNGLARAGYSHVRKPHTPGWAKRGERSTPYADELISASKRWLLATYNKQPREHLPAYLAEFAFRREFRDPGERFAVLLRSLLATPARTRRHMTRAADLPRVVGEQRRKKPGKKSRVAVPKKSRRKKIAQVV